MCRLAYEYCRWVIIMVPVMIMVRLLLLSLAYFCPCGAASYGDHVDGTYLSLSFKGISE